MSAVFFRKRIVKIVALALLVCMLALACICARRKTVEIQTSKDFYFLVDTSSHVEASTHGVQYVGGAGYLLEKDGGACVAYSVYVKEENALRAKETLLQDAKSVEAVKMTGGNMKIRRKDRHKANALQGAMESLYGNICLLEAEIARLEDGATQQSSARILAILERNFEYLATHYADVYNAYAKRCLESARILDEMQKEIIYAKDLRYLQCELCVAYGELTANYPL